MGCPSRLGIMLYQICGPGQLCCSYLRSVGVAMLVESKGRRKKDVLRASRNRATLLSTSGL